MTIPEAGRERLQAGIDRARMDKKRAEHARRRSAWTAVAAAVVVLIALPNTNVQIAMPWKIFRCWVDFSGW